jgi:hypothetical protein
MYPTLDSSSSGGTASTGSIYSYSITIGNLHGSGVLMVGATCQAITANLQNILSITINGVALSHVARISADNGGGYGSRTEFWTLTGITIPQNGTYTIAITYAGNVEAISSGAMAFYNLRPQTYIALGSNSANGTVPLSVNITPTTNNSLIVAIYGSQNDAAVTPGTDQIEVFESRPGSALTCEGSYKILANAALTTMSASLINPESEEIIAVAFQAAPANAGNAIFMSNGGVAVT